jgi:tetratricopeptide (TPR) repeat protein
LPKANRAGPPARRATGTPGLWLAAPLGFAVLLAAFSTNLRVTQADIIYKTAEGFGTADNWEVATRLYLLASSYAPNEDYYYLFVGKGFLEVANRLTDPAEQPSLVAEAEERLEEAQRLNPLNPDHTANLARLYRWWASVAGNSEDQAARAETADDFYAQAVSLSPNSALLWNEWAGLKLALLNDRAGALEIINRSLALDPLFESTHVLLGDYHAAAAREATSEAESAAEYALAAQAYEQAVALEPESLSPRLSLGAVYSATGQIPQAIEWFSGAVQYAPPEANLFNVYLALAELYLRDGDRPEAMQYAELALANAPEAMRPEVQKLIERIRS